MLLIEEQARGKWCSEARVVKTNGAAELVSGNRDSNDQPMGFCIASDCMKWRWEGGIYPDEDKRGFCGLGGLGNIHR